MYAVAVYIIYVCSQMFAECMQAHELSLITPCTCPYTALYNRVRRMHAALERLLHLDGKLLAQLSQHKLVTKEEFHAINAFLEMHNRLSAGTYFINSVLFEWPLELFESKVRRLTEALESHEDGGNQNIARKLRNAYSEDEQPLQPDHLNPGITSIADMPSLTVHAGPDEYHLPLTPHSTVPNTFECVIPEEIRLEAGNEYRFVVNYGNKSVIVTFSVSRCSSKSIHTQESAYVKACITIIMHTKWIRK